MNSLDRDGVAAKATNREPIYDVDEAPAGTSPIVGWPIALPASAAAALFGLSERQWWRLHSAGRIPLPLRIGRACRWILDGPDGLRAWAEGGCLPRDRWQELRARNDKP